MSKYTYEPYFFEDGSISSEYWHKDGKLHREGDKPAFIWYHEDGSILQERWFKDNQRHREGDKPAFIWYREDGSIEEEHWFKDGIEYIPQTDSCHNKVVEIDGKKYKLTLVD